MGRSAICARAPTRIDFAGGWTDVAEYAHDPPGAVLNVAISLHGYATVRPRADGSRRVTIASADFGRRVEAESPEALTYDGTLDLLKGAIRALDPGVGVTVVTRSIAPPGSGLGTSASMCVALLAALNRFSDAGRTPHDLAELACRIEREDLHIRGGKQDQYASAAGGFSFLAFDGARATHAPLLLDADLQREMHRRLVLCFTGTSRLSGDNHRRVAEAFAAGEPPVVEAIRDLKRLTHEMREALLGGDLAEAGRLLNETWASQKRLHPAVTTEQIDSLFEAALAAGAMGGKVCGAGGGGCLVFLAAPGREHDVRRTLIEAGAEIREFEFDLTGVRTWPARGTGQ